MYIRTIERRKKDEFKAQAVMAEWLAKHISLTVAQTVGGKDGVALQKNVLKRIKFNLDEDDDADTQSEAPGAEDDYDFVEKGSRKAQNQVGSLEALMGGLG